MIAIMFLEPQTQVSEIHQASKIRYFQNPLSIFKLIIYLICLSLQKHRMLLLLQLRRLRWAGLLYPSLFPLDPPVRLQTYTIAPFPYDQPNPSFPQRSDLPRVEPQATPAGTVGAAPAPPPEPLVHADLLMVSPPTYHGSHWQARGGQD